MKVLLTGFDPFGGESVNPAFEAIKLLPDTIAGAEIVKVEIPTEFTRSISCVEAAIKEHKPGRCHRCRTGRRTRMRNRRESRHQPCRRKNPGQRRRAAVR